MFAHHSSLHSLLIFLQVNVLPSQPDGVVGDYIVSSIHCRDHINEGSEYLSLVDSANLVRAVKVIGGDA